MRICAPTPASLLQKVCSFLDVDDSFTFDTKTQHGQSAKGREFALGLGKLRHLKAYADLSMMLPEWVKCGLREGLSKPKDVVRPAWSDNDKAWFRTRYEAPSRAYLERVGRNPNFWAWEG